MGLFINSQLQSISIHKRLTELEKLSEISTGILALKAMVEGGSDLSGRKIALDNLARMLPMLSETQQNFVLNEIFAPLLADDETTTLSGGTNEFTEGDDESYDETKRASSDYEMEFQLKLNRQGKLDLKQLNREQRDYRNAQEQEKQKVDRISEARERVFTRLEKSWDTIDLAGPPKKLKLELMKFIYSFNNSLGREHPILVEAREHLQIANENVKKSQYN
jgi:hypothetical protein